MKAIITKYHGPTNYKGSRITATDEDGNRATISYPYELSGEAVHRKAAQALCDKMGWQGTLAGGSLKHGYVFTFMDIAPDEMLVNKKLFNDLVAERKQLLSVASLAIKYLEHPDVQAMPFALSAKVVAERMHKAIAGCVA